MRRYNKWILAVGGTLLLIVFLIPQAIQGLSQRAAMRSASRAIVGDGEEVPAMEWANVQEEAQFLDRLGVSVPSIGQIGSPSHWYLLVREADAVGMVGGDATVAATPDQISLVARQVGKSPEFVRSTEAKLSGVARLISLYNSASKLSDRRMRHLAKRLFHAANADLVVLEADPDQSDYEPSEEEIQAQLAKYADVAPGEGERGFGYRLPDRVNIEWITIPTSSVRQMIENSDEINGIALRRHWKKYQQSRGFPTVQDSAAIPQVVREDLIETLTEEKLDEIAKQASQLLVNPRRGLTEIDGYLVLPDDWADQQLPLPQLAATLQDNYGIETPIYQSMGDEWLSMEDLAALDALQQASTDKFGDPPANIAALAAAAQEFGGDSRILVQEGVAMPALRTNDGDVHIARITATDVSRPPASLDEVRQAVVDDLRRLHQYEQLVTEIDAVTEAAQTNGMLALALENDTIVRRSPQISLANLGAMFTQASQGLPVRQTPSELPAVGQAPEAVELIIDRALTLPPMVDLSTIPEEQRTFVVPLPDHLALLVVRLTQQYPVTEESFATLVQSKAIQMMMLSEELDSDELFDDAFSLDAMSERHEFALRTGDDDEDSDAEETNETNEGGSAPADQG
jgi:hypothetical protein